jgi:hypothetical protein
MIVYKFLCSGAIGPFSGYRWPLPEPGAAGPWVVSAADAAVCHRGVHACRLKDLPWWLQDELWEAELDGTVTAGRHKVMAPRGRLVRRIDAWDAGCAQRFADACAQRAREHAATALERTGESETTHLAAAMAKDGARRARRGHAVPAAYIAAHAAAQVDGPDAMDAERAWQSEWLRTALALPTT